MPTYRYRCMKCQHEWENTTAVDLRRTGVVCPVETCKSLEFELVPGRPTHHLKGGGWARDGYRGK